MTRQADQRQAAHKKIFTQTHERRFPNGKISGWNRPREHC
ncbi:hypothetical protein AK972_4381 [Pseudomonas yamanorum]|nr:hypothetical protein AK972_4381 [Pseudomonas yamanorum]